MSDSSECSFSLVVAILASRLSSKSVGLVFFFLVSLYVYLNKTGGVCFFGLFLLGFFLFCLFVCLFFVWVWVGFFFGLAFVLF